jgi:hypothetical protein
MRKQSEKNLALAREFLRSICFFSALAQVRCEKCHNSSRSFKTLFSDGHTASLFPEHPLLNVTDRLIIYIVDSPKPPPKRITMTYPLINNARYSIFTVPGKGKAEIIKKIFEDKVDFPAARVDSKKVIWLLDQDSASDCSIEFETA